MVVIQGDYWNLANSPSIWSSHVNLPPSSRVYPIARHTMCNAAQWAREKYVGLVKGGGDRDAAFVIGAFRDEIKFTFYVPRIDAKGTPWDEAARYNPHNTMTVKFQNSSLNFAFLSLSSDCFFF